jgi:hypothetical protein
MVPEEDARFIGEAEPPFRSFLPMALWPEAHPFKSKEV